MAQRPAITTIDPNPGVPPIVGPPIEASPAAQAAAEARAQAAPGAAADGMPRWLERAELFLRVLLRMYIGIAVCFAPWVRIFWDQNPFIQQFPWLAVYLDHGAVRGLVSGIGLLNLWIAFRDATGRRDR